MKCYEESMKYVHIMWSCVVVLAFSAGEHIQWLPLVDVNRHVCLPGICSCIIGLRNACLGTWVGADHGKPWVGHSIESGRTPQVHSTIWSFSALRNAGLGTWVGADHRKPWVAHLILLKAKEEPLKCTALLGVFSAQAKYI